MEEQQPQLNLPSAPFPAPPPFWKHFTAANLDKLKEIETQNSTDTPASGEASQNQKLPKPPSSLPLELSYLLPPPPPNPSNISYPAFSTQIPLSPKPPPLDPEVALFDTTSPHLTRILPALLTRLTRSILLNFLELATVLSTPTLPPSPPAEPLWRDKVADLQRLFTNALYCVNLYRPHQAREGVIEWLEEEIEKGEEEVRRLDDVKERMEGFLAEIGELGGEFKGGDGTDDRNKVYLSGTEHNGTTGMNSEDEEVHRAQKLWKAIHDLDYV